MKPLYPQAQLLLIKPKERLSTFISELERLQEFFGADKLIQQAQSLIDQIDTQVEDINTCIEQIKNFIALNAPISKKLNQINYLIESVPLCLRSTEVQPIRSELDVQKDKFQQLKKNGVDNLLNLEKLFGEVDSIFVNRIPELFKKIKEKYSEGELSPCYETYFQNQISSIQIIKGDQKNKVHFFFQQLSWLMDFLQHFEGSYQQFNELQAKFKYDRENYLKLSIELINSESICDRKMTIEQQINILDKDFKDFDPAVSFPQQLELGLIQLDTELNDLTSLNQGELRKQKEQYVKLIDLLIDSKVNLTLHAKKLKSNFFWKQSGKNKYQVIENIQQKMDALLESGTHQEPSRSSKQTIIDLQQAINEAKTILSVYRGIPLLRCFATLWGGGKVTSQLLVQTLEEQLTDLQHNINRLYA